MRRRCLHYTHPPMMRTVRLWMLLMSQLCVERCMIAFLALLSACVGCDAHSHRVGWARGVGEWGSPGAGVAPTPMIAPLFAQVNFTHFQSSQ